VERVDAAVVGGGILGLATAHALLRARPVTSLVLLEKEPALAAHQSGRNSGVLHSGIYYRPGSLKARLAVAGRASMLRFCAEHGIPHAACGKLVIATRESELDRLGELARRAPLNGVRVTVLDRAGIRAVEPHASGIAALHVHDTGIADFAGVCRTLAGLVTAGGGEIRLATTVVGLHGAGPTVVDTDAGALEARVVVNCAGLWSDRLARSRDVRIVPFRGEYLAVAPNKAHLVRALVYPVPDPAFPFLGAHLTRDVHGHVHAGPNAVLALAREGYRWRDVDPAEVRALVAFPGVRTLARRYWRTGAAEVTRSASRRLMARALARLVPGIAAADLVRAPAGVRAQAVDVAGNLLDDFVIREEPGAVHLVNAPSPGATASLEIGAHVAGLATAQLDATP
jgi:L-2-hydroxyglutarate oxidase